MAVAATGSLHLLLATSVLLHMVSGQAVACHMCKYEKYAGNRQCPCMGQSQLQTITTEDETHA